MLLAITLAGTTLSIFSTIMLNTYFGDNLNLGESLLTISCLYIIQLFISYNLVIGLSMSWMIYQSINKTQNVLLLSESPIKNDHNDEVIIKEESQLISSNSLTIDNQDSFDSCFNLLRLNFEINPGELIMVVGKVGSGKSRLLLNLLGEETIHTQNYSHSNKIAYYCEAPWVFNSSIRENILMGREYNPDLYNNVIKCCCLNEEIENMPYNDETIVSDRGTTLSGGQKARLCLARVLYSQFDVFLLDDPLSSLDSKVCKRVFKKCILKMLANKSRVIVMRNYDYLHYADKILVVDGNNSFFGSFDEFSQKYLPADLNNFTITRGLRETSKKDISSCNLIVDLESKKRIYKMSLKSATYYNYFTLGFKSKFLIALLIMLLLLNVCSIVYFYFYTTEYSDESPTTEKTLNYLAAIFLVYISFTVPTMILTYGIGKSNEKLHENAIKTVSKLPLAYFDENSSGIILNKLIKDTSVCDNNLLPKIQEFSLVFFITILRYVFIVIILPYTIIPISILLSAYYLSIIHLLPICNSMRRLEIILTDPMLSLSCSVLTGLSTIRSLKIQSYMKILMKNSLLDLYRVNLTSTYLSSFFVMILEYTLTLINVVIVAIIIITKDSFFNNNLLLIAFMMIIAFHGSSGQFLFLILKFDSFMISAQNLFELSESPKEDNSQRKDLQVTNGKLEFMNLSIKYGEKYALSHISCVIKPGSKIAIIGRTGAGKSTIFKALLRLVNPVSGTIFIDDQDYLNYSPKCIRRLISTNPQTSLIFYGSIRQNLDPFKEYSDEKIISTLSILNFDSALIENLDNENFGKDSNLSFGEKQLFNLARILLKKSKIVLIDEPTSSIDHTTEELIRNIVNEKLKDCTILTISHQEDIFKNYDQFMLIDNGALVECSVIPNLN